MNKYIICILFVVVLILVLFNYLKKRKVAKEKEKATKEHETDIITSNIPAKPKSRLGIKSLKLKDAIISKSKPDKKSESGFNAPEMSLPPVTPMQISPVSPGFAPGPMMMPGQFGQGPMAFGPGMQMHTTIPPQQFIQAPNMPYIPPPPPPGQTQPRSPPFGSFSQPTVNQNEQLEHQHIDFVKPKKSRSTK